MMAMEILRHLVFTFLGVLTHTVLVHSQDQSGFVSIDCGLQANSSYADAITGLVFKSDVDYIDTGISRSISSDFDADSIERQLWTVRSFPEGEQNCYNVTVIRGNRYLIRARFMYGNYDGLNDLPTFDLHLGPNKWSTVRIGNSSRPYLREIIHIIPSNYIYVCLVNTGSGTPFISSLELRPLRKATYAAESGSLSLFARYDMGSTTNQTVRYPDDVYDRFWFPNNQFQNISTSQTVDYQGHNIFQPPSIVMRTACTPRNASEALNFMIDITNNTLQYYYYFHFAEITDLQANESRQFNISLNDKVWYGPVKPAYLYTFSVYDLLAENETEYSFSLFKVGGSTQPPLLNAIEIYYVAEMLQPQTEQGDVDAILSIKSTYGITSNWQGDPCAPQAYVWKGLSCSYDDSAPSRIISLNLSSRGLMEVTPDIKNLKLLESLDLSNNSLTGPVPDFLSQLSALKYLNLTRNNLSGTIPVALYEKWQNGSLVLSVDGNLEHNRPTVSSRNKKDKHITVPVVVSVAAFFAIVAVSAIILWTRKRRKRQGGRVDIQTNQTHEPLVSIKQQFTYSEILNITNNFERIIGKGAFGTVYHGYLDNAQVAVKVLSSSSVQGYKEFQAEVKLLLQVHHKNLTTLVGFCDDGTNMGLIYEYMANGNLGQHLSGQFFQLMKSKHYIGLGRLLMDADGSPYILSWNARLQISLEAAQGLEYLHNGCKPPIVHRDVKTSNILLNEKFQAKLSDFGLSRTFPVEGGNHVSTVVAGTPGYLDPEYYGTNWLTEKSDVFSLGVVLMEIITSRPVLSEIQGRSAHLIQWVSSMLDNGDIKSIVDQRLSEDYDINSVWKVVELAVTCVSESSINRPTMNQVVTELNESLEKERARTGERNGTESKDSIELIP